MAVNRIIQITSAGLDPRSFIEEVEAKIHMRLQIQLERLADECVARMREILLHSGYNLSNLADKINKDILQDGNIVEIGIGKIADLPVYWEWFNNGFKPMATGKFVPLGIFSPGLPRPGDDKGGKWIVGGWSHNGVNYTFVDRGNKNVILPIKYIDTASEELFTKIQTLISGLMQGMV